MAAFNGNNVSTDTIAVAQVERFDLNDLNQTIPVGPSGMDVHRFNDARLQLSAFDASPASFEVEVQHSLDGATWFDIGTSLTNASVSGGKALTAVIDVSGSRYLRAAVIDAEGSALTCTATLVALTPKET